MGAEAFFDMFVIHNYIHADAHGGNIIVQMQEKSLTFFGEIWEWMQEQFIRIEDKLTARFIEEGLLKNLFEEGRDEAAYIRSVARGAKDRVFIKIIDTGMVITLTEVDRKNFLQFIQNIIKGNGK